MTPAERGHLCALRNLLHGAPTTQNILAARLRTVDNILTTQSPRFRLRREPDYWKIAGNILDKLDQHR
jgi:hypothetical protein